MRGSWRPGLVGIGLALLATFGIARADEPLSFSEPLAGATVSGVVGIRLAGNPQAGEFTVLLYEDDRWLFGTTTLPCLYEWDTAALSEGPHTLRAEIYWEGRLQYRTPSLTVQIRRRPQPTPSPSPSPLQEVGPGAPRAENPSAPAQIITLPAPTATEALPPPATRPTFAAATLTDPPFMLDGLVVARSHGALALRWGGEPVDVSLRWVRALQRVYAPVRVLMEALGAYVAWEQDSKRVRLLHQGREAQIQVGQSVAQREGETVSLPGPLQLTNQRTWFPVRSLEALYALPVHWQSTEA